MHHGNAEKLTKEKAWLELQKNAMSYIEQILEATLHKTRPLTSHLYNHPSKKKKICETLLEMQGWSHKWPSLMDSNTLMYQLCVNIGWSLEDLPGAMDDRDGWRKSGKSVLVAWSDDEDIYIYIYIIYIYIYMYNYKIR